MASITETATVQSVPPMETVQLKLQTRFGGGHIPHPPTIPKSKFKQRIDPQRALEPARKKLSTLEAQRIMAVLVDSIRRSELVTAMPHIMENLERYKTMLGAELTQMFTDHKVVVQSFIELQEKAEEVLRKEELARQKEEELLKASQDEESLADDEMKEFGADGKEPSALSRRDTDPDMHIIDEEPSNADREDTTVSHQSRVQSGGSYTSQAEAAVHQLALVAKEMQHSCKNILRQFTLNPAAITRILQEVNADRGLDSKRLIFEMNELKDIIMGMLLTTPIEEIERNQYLQEVSERDRRNAGVIEKLETELNAAVDDKDGEIRKKNDIIRRLQADLHQIERFSEEHNRRTKTEAEKQEAADIKNSEGKKIKLQQEINQLKSQLANLISEHRDSEQQLRKKKFKVETEVENWIQKYDNDMGERQDEFEEIDAVYTEEKKQLNELEERFKTLEAEYTTIVEERRIANARREAAERELQMAVKAATTIQAFWRSHKVRKALKSKKKKGGGKKKK